MKFNFKTSSERELFPSQVRVCTFRIELSSRDIFGSRKRKRKKEKKKKEHMIYFEVGILTER